MKNPKRGSQRVGTRTGASRETPKTHWGVAARLQPPLQPPLAIHVVTRLLFKLLDD